jgi:hypothetical protein
MDAIAATSTAPRRATKPAIFRHNRAIPSPKPARQETKTVSMWGNVGVFGSPSLFYSVHQPSESPKPCKNTLQRSAKHTKNAPESSLHEQSDPGSLPPCPSFILHPSSFILQQIAQLPTTCYFSPAPHH